MKGRAVLKYSMHCKDYTTIYDARITILLSNWLKAFLNKSSVHVAFWPPILLSIKQ